MKTNELLKQDLVQSMLSRPTREEAEVLAGRIVDLIHDAAQEINENILMEHVKTFDHSFREGY